MKTAAAIPSIAYPVSADQDEPHYDQESDLLDLLMPSEDEFEQMQLAAEEELHRNRGRFTRPAIRMSPAAKAARNRN